MRGGFLLHAYGPPPIRFIEQDVDQARAASVVIELDHSTPIIVDRPLYREHGRRVRELAEQAHGANLDLGWALMNNGANVDPGDTTVAKFFFLGGHRHSRI
jgi:hypothetical protein